MPGSAFGEPRALRISYTCPTAQLPEGLRRFQEFFAELQACSVDASATHFGAIHLLRSHRR